VTNSFKTEKGDRLFCLSPCVCYWLSCTCALLF